MIMKRYFIICLLVLCAMDAVGQQNDSVRRLEEVSVGAKRKEGISRLSGAENGQQIGQDELFRAACCNLGESFVTNPSVDVNYNDAAVGAKQIKLLGLSGQYVQMLIEGLPMPTGAAMPYLLGQVPGAWMKSISVSKGTSSVKQGFQSITGQIDVEYLKPEEEAAVLVNLFGDSRLRAEANASANVHINKYLSTELLTHWEQDFGHHDDNHDGWHDSPAVRQYQLQNRWKYVKGRYIMHAGIGYLDESREGGQMLDFAANPFRVLVDSRRVEGYMKHAWLINREHNTNIALLATANGGTLGGTFGNRRYDNAQRELNAQLVLEHDFNDAHTLSTGLSLAADHFDEQLLTFNSQLLTEYTPGAYAQYTFKPSYHFTLMAGLRADRYLPSVGDARWLFTPRMHLKWVVSDWVTLRATTGKGYRIAHPLAENHYLLASGRTLNIPFSLRPEEAWNSGISAICYIPAGERNVTVNAEYYFTDFLHQAVVDYDSDPLALSIYDLVGRSYSHTAQVDATYPISEEWELMAAFRLNRVMCTYGGVLKEKPLQSRYKGLFTLSWKPLMGLWQVDLTFQMNGPGRMPEPYLLPDGSLSWERESPAYPQLNMQITREFRHFSIYVGGENLTNYTQPNPIIDAANPWSPTFEPTMIWGPVHGAMAYAGIRLKI